MRDFVPMKLVPGTAPIPLELGQTIMVYIEEMVVPMTVTKIYSDGSFDGSVNWGEA